MRIGRLLAVGLKNWAIPRGLLNDRWGLESRGDEGMKKDLVGDNKPEVVGDEMKILDSSFLTIEFFEFGAALRPMSSSELSLISALLLEFWDVILA